jgi:hypothetical protein
LLESGFESSQRKDTTPGKRDILALEKNCRASTPYAKNWQGFFANKKTAIAAARGGESSRSATGRRN